MRRYNIFSTINRKALPNGVTVAQLILVQFVEVRILIGQPFLPSVKLLNSLKLNLICPSFPYIIPFGQVVKAVSANRFELDSYQTLF